MTKGRGQARDRTVARCRLVATDLDGTLLRSDGTLSDRTLDVLGQLRTRGIETVFVTARHSTAVLRLGVPASLVPQAIVCVGAGRLGLADGEVTHCRQLDTGVLRPLVDRLREAVSGIAFGWVTASTSDDLTVEAAYFLNGRRTDLPQGDARRIERPVLKLFARSPEGLYAGNAFAESVSKVLDGDARIAHSAAGFVDLVHPKVSKQAALEELCAEQGIAAHEVVAFGDTAADLPMLAWAGHGVATGNADDVVRQGADEITNGCDEDGVALSLSAHFGLTG